jgi:hypothetical protein
VPEELPGDFVVRAAAAPDLPPAAASSCLAPIPNWRLSFAWSSTTSQREQTTLKGRSGNRFRAGHRLAIGIKVLVCPFAKQSNKIKNSNKSPSN